LENRGKHKIFDIKSLIEKIKINIEIENQQDNGVENKLEEKSPEIKDGKNQE